MYWLIVALAATKVIPAGIGLYNYKRLKPSLRTITLLVVLGAINEILLFILAKAVGNNLYLLHIFALIEVCLLIRFFWFETIDFKLKRSLPFIAAAMGAFAVGYAAYGNNLFAYPSEPRVFNAIVLIILCGLLFYEMATTGDSHDPIKNGTYFVNGAVMLYFTATFITWLMMKYVIDEKTVVYALYGSHAYINAFCNLVFAYGLWISSRSSLSLS